jgi:hypothetical protein
MTSRLAATTRCFPNSDFNPSIIAGVSYLSTFYNHEREALLVAVFPHIGCYHLIMALPYADVTMKTMPIDAPVSVPDQDVDWWWLSNQD